MDHDKEARVRESGDVLVFAFVARSASSVNDKLFGTLHNSESADSAGERNEISADYC